VAPSPTATSPSWSCSIGRALLPVFGAHSSLTVTTITPKSPNLSPTHIKIVLLHPPV
jgi:hypothetical protein